MTVHALVPSMTSFDVAFEPWIPVISFEGTESRVGLRDVLIRAHELTLDFDHFGAESAVLRILSAITYTVSGIHSLCDDQDSFDNQRIALLDAGRFDPDRVDSYFDKYADRFDLFHPERPWLQVRNAFDLNGGKNSMSRLIGVSTSDNASPIAGDVDASHQFSACVEDVVGNIAKMLTFGPGGMSPGRIDCPPDRKVTSTSIFASPLRGTSSYFAVGGSLFETLILSSVTLTDLGLPARGFDPQKDRAVWERDSVRPFPDPDGPYPRVTGPVAACAGAYYHAIEIEIPGGEFVTNVRLGTDVCKLDQWVKVLGKRDPEVGHPCFDPFITRRAAGSKITVTIGGKSKSVASTVPTSVKSKEEIPMWMDVLEPTISVDEEVTMLRPASLTSGSRLRTRMGRRGSAKIVRCYWNQDGKTKDLESVRNSGIDPKTDPLVEVWRMEAAAVTHFRSVIASIGSTYLSKDETEVYRNRFTTNYWANIESVHDALLAWLAQVDRVNALEARSFITRTLRAYTANIVKIEIHNSSGLSYETRKALVRHQAAIYRSDPFKEGKSK